MAFYVSFISGWEPSVDLETFLHCLDRSKSGANTSLGAVQTSRQSSSFPPTSTTWFLLISHPAFPPVSHPKMVLEHLGTGVPSGMWKLLYQFITLDHEGFHIFSKGFYQRWKNVQILRIYLCYFFQAVLIFWLYTRKQTETLYYCHSAKSNMLKLLCY